MKKILRAIKKFFIKLYKPIDKFLIMPITKLILKIKESSDASGKKLENWLSKKNTILFISLFISIIIFVVVDQKIIGFSQTSAEVLKNQPVEVKYNEEAYVVEGVPDTVDITIIGNETEIYIAKQSPSNGVVLDLTNLKPGTHKVTLSYSQTIGSVDYTVNPAVANITIYQKVSETRTLTTDILNQEKLDSKLSISNIDVGTDQVVIKGAQYQVDQVANVKALIDINNLVKQEVGTITLKDVPLKAYDEKGNVVDVEILPETLDVEITIVSSSKTVPFKIIPNGDVAFGNAISSITLSENNITVYGSEEVLDAIDYIPVEIDVAGLSDDKEYKVELTKPVGVKSMSINNLTINVALGESSTRDIADIPIEYLNFDDTLYDLRAASNEDRTITVSLTGVESVINGITADDIKAYIDLDGYTEGTYDVDVIVEGTDLKAQYVAKTKKVKVTITAK
ncbi:MAG: CdaR family protein [Bacilli bacterium]|nr:CdaR family protein [Bacilli bacterium]